MDKYRTISLSSWRTPASTYRDRTLGSARLKTIKQRRGGVYSCYQQAPPGESEGYAYYSCGASLPIKVLQIDGQTVMVDDAPHYWAIQKLAKQYVGRVLVAGLGLGLIAQELAAQDCVTEVTVVEHNADVIGLVGPYLSSTKIKIINEDWYQLPKQDCDGLFFDLFVGNFSNYADPAAAEYLRLIGLYSELPIHFLGIPTSIIEILSMMKLLDPARKVATDWLIRPALPSRR